MKALQRNFYFFTAVLTLSSCASFENLTDDRTRAEDDEMYWNGKELFYDNTLVASAAAVGDDYYDPNSASRANSVNGGTNPRATFNPVSGWQLSYGLNAFSNYSNGVGYGNYGNNGYGYNPYGNNSYGYNPYSSYNPYGGGYGYNPYAYGMGGLGWGGNGYGNGWYGNNNNNNGNGWGGGSSGNGETANVTHHHRRPVSVDQTEIIRPLQILVLQELRNIQLQEVHLLLRVRLPITILQPTHRRLEPLRHLRVLRRAAHLVQLQVTVLQVTIALHLDQHQRTALHQKQPLHLTVHRRVQLHRVRGLDAKQDFSKDA